MSDAAAAATRDVVSGAVADSSTAASHWGGAELDGGYASEHSGDDPGATARRTDDYGNLVAPTTARPGRPPKHVGPVPATAAPDVVLDTENYKFEAMLVEVKGPRDRLSDKQRAWLAALGQGGLRVEVFRVHEPPATAAGDAVDPHPQQ